MNVLITGSTGLIGSALVESFNSAGYLVVRLVRREPSSAHEASWNVRTGEIDPELVESAGVVIHLAGENLAGGRWIAKRKQRIFDSRGQVTRNLCSYLASNGAFSGVFICASATGFYDDRGAEELIEEISQGEGFLAEC